MWRRSKFLYGLALALDEIIRTRYLMAIPQKYQYVLRSFMKRFFGGSFQKGGPAHQLEMTRRSDFFLRFHIIVTGTIYRKSTAAVTPE